MARPPEDPRITDLRRYKKAREAQARQAAKPRRAKEPFLGSRPRAGLILVLALAVMALLWIAPALL